MPMRDPIEYVRDSGEVFDRVVYTPGTYEPNPPPKGPKRWNPIRVQLLWDPSFGPVELCETEVTSEHIGAQELNGGRQSTLEMVESECRWLHRQLTELIARWDLRDAEAAVRSAEAAATMFPKEPNR